jgi:hypothetical protein
MLRDVAQSFCQDATSRSGVHPWRSPMLSPRGTPPRGSASARRACGAPRRRTVFAGEGGLEATAAITSPLDSPRSGFSSIDSLDSPISLEWSLQCSTPKDVDEPPDPLAPPGDMSGGGLLRASHKASLLLTSPPKRDGESRGDTIIDQMARCMPRRGPPAIPSAGSTLSTVNGCTTPSPLRSNSQLCSPRGGRRALGDDDGDSPWRAAWTVRVHDEPPQQPLFLQVPALQRSEGEDASDFMARVHFREPSSGRHDEELMSSAADDSAADDSSSGDGRTSPEGAAAPACADLSGLLRRRRRPTAADGNEEEGGPEPHTERKKRVRRGSRLAGVLGEPPRARRPSFEDNLVRAAPPPPAAHESAPTAADYDAAVFDVGCTPATDEVMAGVSFY